MKKVLIGSLIFILAILLAGIYYIGVPKSEKPIEPIVSEKAFDSDSIKIKPEDDTIPPVQVPIFMYHSFTNAANVNKHQDGLIVTKDKFEEQLRFLKENNCHAIDFYELYQYITEGKALPENAFIITMDDVYREQYTIAYPLLKKYRFKATLFINTSEISKNHCYSWDALREMENSGYIDVQSHGHWHIAINTLDKQKAIYTVSHSFDLIEAYLGDRKIRVFCYPSYSYSQSTRKWLGSTADIQVTKLGKYADCSSRLDNIKRFRVSNSMFGQSLYNIITQSQYPAVHEKFLKE